MTQIQITETSPTPLMGGGLRRESFGSEPFDFELRAELLSRTLGGG